MEVMDQLVPTDLLDHPDCKVPMETLVVVVKLATRETRASPDASVPWVLVDLRGLTDLTELLVCQDLLERVEALACEVT